MLFPKKREEKLFFIAVYLLSNLGYPAVEKPFLANVYCFGKL